MQDKKELEGLKIARNVPKINHPFLLTMRYFSSKLFLKIVGLLKSVLARFCDISGEIINFDKSHVIFSPNTPPKFMKIMRRPLGVESKSTVGNYLGCPMEVDGRNTWSFNTLITKTVDKIL